MYDWLFSKFWLLESERNDDRVNAYRRQVWPEVKGKVLDLGPGYAQSLELLTMSEISSYVALEPNPFMYEKLQANAEKCGFSVEYDKLSYPEGKSESADQSGVPFKIVRGVLDDRKTIPQAVLDNAPYDTVLTSFSLCSAKNINATLDNIVRLLKPGGAHIFIEHVRHPPRDDPHVVEDNGINARFWGIVQDIINPVWSVCGKGCHCNLETGKIIAATDGWESVNYKSVRPAEALPSRIMPLTFGKAIKSA
ncbi:hypothetical protein H4S01_000925 [Coemansia sp. RSA 2610]|nr:hypothetical protein H4S01_000925 [Coemansia sp. RSA 2610]